MSGGWAHIALQTQLVDMQPPGALTNDLALIWQQSFMLAGAPAAHASLLQRCHPVRPSDGANAACLPDISLWAASK